MKGATNKGAKRSCGRALTGWLAVIGTLLCIFGIIAGHNVWPDNGVFQWLWWLLWFGALPIILIISILLADKGKSKLGK